MNALVALVILLFIPSFIMFFVTYMKYVRK